MGRRYEKLKRLVRFGSDVFEMMVFIVNGKVEV